MTKELLKDLYYGLNPDFKKQLDQDIIDKIRRLLFLSNSEEIFCFYYSEHDWHYFHSSDGSFDKIRVDKYSNFDQKKLKELKEKYSPYTFFEYDDCLINFSSIIETIDSADKYIIQILPIGIMFDEIATIQPTNNVFFLVINKKDHQAEVRKDYIYGYDIFGIDSSEIIKKDDIYEDMEFEFSSIFNERACEYLYSITRQYMSQMMPGLETQCSYSDDICEAMFDIERKINYPIYANPKLNTILGRSDVTVDNLILNGFHPECYKIEDCFGVFLNTEKVYSFEDIKVLKKWQAVVSDSNLGTLLAHYEENNRIKLGASGIGRLLILFEQVSEDNEMILKFIMRGIANENLDCYQTILDVMKLYNENQIKSWKGRYSQTLLNRFQKRSSSCFSEEVLDKLEVKPTLDNLYKLLIL